MSSGVATVPCGVELCGVHRCIDAAMEHLAIGLQVLRIARGLRSGGLGIETRGINGANGAKRRMEGNLGATGGDRPRPLGLSQPEQ